MPSSVDVDPTILSTLERLILSQAIYEFGSNAWADVSKLLTKHPQLTRPHNFFTEKSCSTLYNSLMHAAGLKWSEADIAPLSSTHLQLAQGHYIARLSELRTEIAGDEVKFKTLVSEIEDIKSGKWDDKIYEKLGIPLPKEEVPQSPPAAEERRVDEESILVDSAAEAVEDFETKESAAATEVTAQDVFIHEINPEQRLEQVVVEETEQTPEPQPEESEEPESKSQQEPVLEPAPSPVVEERQDGEAAVDQPVESPPHVERPEEGEVPPSPIEKAATPAPEISMEFESPGEAPAPVEETMGEEKEPIVDEEAPTTITDQEEMQEEPAEVEQISTPPESPVEDPRRSKTPEDIVMEEREEAITPAPEAETSVRSEGKRKASDLEGPPADGQRDRKRAREESEPVEEEEPLTGPSGTKSRRRGHATEAQQISKRFQNVIGMLHSTISQHRYGNIFHNPIKKSEAPDYPDIVKRPMDLKTIKTRVKDGLIANSMEFQRDVYLMFANAMMYNRPGSEIYNMAEEMMLESEQHINTFRQTEGFHRI